MANYANSKGFANAFNALSGVLGQFLAEEIQKGRENRHDQRTQAAEARAQERYEKNAEQALRDTLVRNTMNYVQQGKMNLYDNNNNQITDINYSGIVPALRKGEVMARPNPAAVEAAADANRYLITADESTAGAVNRAYGTKYKAGDRIPYSMIGGIGTRLSSQERAVNLGNFTDKQLLEYINRVETNAKERLLFDPEYLNSHQGYLWANQEAKRRGLVGQQQNDDPLGLRLKK